MKIRLIKNKGIQFYKCCKECKEHYWTPFLFKRICLKCKFKNSSFFNGETVKREHLIDFMEFAINHDDIPEMSTVELMVDSYLKSTK